MSPAERAAAALPQGTFRGDLEAHLLHGFVFSTPAAFLMGRPINSRAPHHQQADPWHVFPAEEQDCWLVWLAAGDLRGLWRLVPYRLPLLAWARRDGPLRFFAFERFESALANFHRAG